jgi:hypothetical protein
MREQLEDETVWGLLAAEGNFTLIEKLRYAQLGEDGFGTIVVPLSGFSPNDASHNLVLEWLKVHNINICNPRLEEARMERALHPQRSEG